ncbi:MAG TPA: nitroreductase family protein [Syntrophobacteraceae bacterium]|nr:nitroreductase family protein [Syntrophobacteraceae bacterium]
MEYREIVESRRAVNYFDPNKPVSPDQLRQLIELAAKVPSSFNLQPWNVIAVTDSQKKKALRQVAWDQPKVEEAPVVLIVLGDRDGWKPGNETLERNFSEFVKAGIFKPEQHEWFLGACRSLYGESLDQQQAFACKNAGFFAMGLMFAARELGLHSHPMDGFDHQAVRKLFKIPDNYWIPLLLAVGHFDQSKTLFPPKWRKSHEDILVSFD